ncbi:uncharacterized protein LOC133801751 [Humulus lupulus]|uniref:uncharacterized protein LOC133801751 n=1 Tax=Humulus lupulus TaxID=3486 RepID=UPI002B4150DB|nr:uncharacterized protein LOC133801751 [Humulus lupulus]
MDHALILHHCRNSHFNLHPSTRFNINSYTKLTKPHDLVFLRPKHKTLNNNSSITTSTDLTLGHQPKRININTTTQAHHGRFSLSALPSSSSDHHDYGHQDQDHDDYEGGNSTKIAKIVSSWRASLALGYVLGILCCGSMVVFMRPQNAIASFHLRFPSRSSSTREPAAEVGMISPVSGRNTLKTFLHGVLFLTSANPKATSMANVPPMGSGTEEISALKKKAIELIKVGRRDEALKLMNKKRDAVMRAPEEKYYVEMAIIELLIILGEYREALRLGYLDDENKIPSDFVRRDFYKAVIYTMMGKDEAEKFWQEFEDGYSGGGPFSPY